MLPPNPPDPTADDIATGRAVVGILEQLGDVLALLPLDVDQRRKLNAGTRRLAESRRLFAELALAAAPAAGAAAEHDAEAVDEQADDHKAEQDDR